MEFEYSQNLVYFATKNQIHIWNTATWKEQVELDCEGRHVLAVLWMTMQSDRPRILTVVNPVSHEDPNQSLWLFAIPSDDVDVVSKSSSCALPEKIHSICLAPMPPISGVRSSIVLCGANVETAFRTYVVSFGGPTGDTLSIISGGTFLGHERGSELKRFGNHVISTGGDGVLCVRESAELSTDWERARRFWAHSTSLLRYGTSDVIMACSPRMLVTAGKDGLVRLWRWTPDGTSNEELPRIEEGWVEQMVS
jgi:WD40 repeat protein